jgi:hypothetical protein
MDCLIADFDIPVFSAVSSTKQGVFSATANFAVAAFATPASDLLLSSRVLGLVQVLALPEMFRAF